MKTKPGRLTIKDANDHSLVSVTPEEVPSRHLVLRVGASQKTTVLESADAVEGLAKHLLTVAAWMRAQETATAEAINGVNDIISRLRDIGMRGVR